MDQELLNEFTKILFPHKENANPPSLDYEQINYLTRLGAQGLECLNGEVSRLNEELAIVEHQTRDMASQNYQIFVQSAQTTNQIKSSLAEGSITVGKINSEILPHLKDTTTEFYEGPCEIIVSQNQGTRALFSKEITLKKILEMHWLVRKCLAIEKLPDAIKILQSSQDMMKNLPEPPEALLKTCNEVSKLKIEIQNALLSKLSSGNIGLSECLQTVSLLRSFFPDDKALRFRFLQSRMKEVSFSHARTWMFDTLTQHRAAFGGDSNHYLSTWIGIQMHRVLADLEKSIDHGVEGIESLFVQASYFGESLARVGADVRGLIIPVFTEHLLRKVQHDLTQYEIQFVKNLHEFNLTSAMVSNISNPESANLDFPGPEDLSPPMQLITHSPLALYLNEVLTLLNTVGKCSLTQLAPKIVLKLNGSVRKIGNELEAWGSHEWSTWEQKEQFEFNRMKRYFEHLLVPHLDKVVRIIFPPTSISEVTGLGISKCAQMIRVHFTKQEDSNS